MDKYYYVLRVTNLIAMASLYASFCDKQNTKKVKKKDTCPISIILITESHIWHVHVGPHSLSSKLPFCLICGKIWWPWQLFFLTLPKH